MELGLGYIAAHLPRHIRTDIEEMASIGATQVTFTLQENHFLYMRGALEHGAKIAEDAGLWPSAIIWGFANTFGGGRNSRVMLERTDLWRRDRNGEPIATACLNNRALVEVFTDFAAQAHKWGYKGIIIDEPQKQECFCDHCQGAWESFAGAGDLTQAADAISYEVFRADTVRGYCHAVCKALKSIDPALVTMNCMMPSHRNYWAPVADCPDLDVFGADPYWLVPHEMCDYDLDAAIRCAIEMKALCKQLGKKSQLWHGAWWIERGREEELYTGGKELADLGCDMFNTWAFRACEGTNETCQDPETAWEAISRLYRGLSGK